MNHNSKQTGIVGKTSRKLETSTRNYNLMMNNTSQAKQNQDLMVINASQTKQNQRKEEKITKFKEKMPNQINMKEKFLRKLKTKVSNPTITVTNASWTKQIQRKEEEISKFKEKVPIRETDKLSNKRFQWLVVNTIVQI